MMLDKDAVRLKPGDQVLKVGDCVRFWTQKEMRKFYNSPEIAPSSNVNWGDPSGIIVGGISSSYHVEFDDPKWNRVIGFNALIPLGKTIDELIVEKLGDDYV